MPAGSAHRQTWRLLLTTNRALRFYTGEPYDTPERRIWRIAAGIRSGPEPLGMMWILEGDDQLSPDRLVLVEEFARLAGAHLLRARTARSADRERRGDLVGQALDGRDPRTACQRLGLPATDLAVLAIADARPDAAEHLLDGVATYFDVYRHSAACVLRGETVYCLLPAAGPRTLRETAADLAQRLGLRRRIAVAVGSRVTADALATSRRHADLVLAALRASGESVGTIDEVRPQATLIELAELINDHPDLLLHSLPLDLTDTADSALAWIEAHGDVRAAAARLGVHPNTLRYRIRRLTAAGLDLNDPATRLTLWLRLTLKP